MTFGLAIDVILIVLLVATLGGGFLVNRRLGVLRSAQAEMQTLLAGLSDATRRAQAGLNDLRTAAESTAHTLDERVREARKLRDDLTYLIDRSGVVADRIDESADRVQSARLSRAPAPAGGEAAEGAHDRRRGTSESERQLIDALRQVR